MLRLGDPVGEPEVIAAFLRAEVSSPRFRDRILAVCRELHVDPAVLERPDTTDTRENARRRDVIVRFRGWGTDEAITAGLPLETIAWHRARLDLDDIRARVFYISWFWEKYSDGTRRPTTVAGRVRPGDDLGPSGEILASVRAGRMPPEPILIARPSLERLVILEGHVRLTAYLIEPEVVPFPIPCFLGITPRASEWSEW